MFSPAWRCAFRAAFGCPSALTETLLYRDAQFDVTIPTGGVTSQGTIIIFFQLYDSTRRWYGGALWFIRSQDAGATWSAPEEVPNARAAYGPLIETPGGLLMTVWDS